MLKRGTEAERAAKQQEKEAQRAAKERKRAEEAFRASPEGQAISAYNQGEQFFQLALEVSAIERRPLGDNIYSSPETQRDGQAKDLAAVERQGWRLEHVGYVYVMTGQTSRDKFLASGQDVGVMGKVMAYYLFRRREDAAAG